MNLIRRITGHFEDSARVQLASAERMAGSIAAAVQLLVETLSNDHKLLICGNGASAADAQHLAVELVGRFEHERMELAALALSGDATLLTALGDDYAFEQVYARQLRALGRHGDVLIVFTIDGNSPNLLAAVQAAHERGIRIVALTGADAGPLAPLLNADDLTLTVPHARAARVREVQRLIIHCLCDGIDAVLLGGSDEESS